MKQIHKIKISMTSITDQAPDNIKVSPDTPIYTDVEKVPLTLLEQMSAHWRTLYEAKRRLHDVSTRQIVFGQLFTVIAAACAGILLETNKTSLLLVGSTLILYPALSGLLASNATVLSASLHHDIDSAQSKGRLVISATLRAIAVVALASVLIGLVSGLLGWVLFGASFLSAVRLSFSAGVLAGAVGLPLSVALTFLIRKLRANPDDTSAPLENTIFSVLTLVAIVLVSKGGV